MKLMEMTEERKKEFLKQIKKTEWLNICSLIVGISILIDFIIFLGHCFIYGIINLDFMSLFWHIYLPFYGIIFIGSLVVVLSFHFHMAWKVVKSRTFGPKEEKEGKE